MPLSVRAPGDDRVPVGQLLATLLVSCLAAFVTARTTAASRTLRLGALVPSPAPVPRAASPAPEADPDEPSYHFRVVRPGPYATDTLRPVILDPGTVGTLSPSVPDT